MAEYIYPAVFHSNDDGTFTITYPDLPGCISEGKSLRNAIYMAQSALAQWLEYLTDKKLSIPAASDPLKIVLANGEFINLVRVDIRDSRAVKHTVSIPKWLDDMAADSGISLSKILQEALKKKFNVA